MSSGPPLVADGAIYLAGVIYDSNSGVVLAIDARTGQERWRTVLDQYADLYAGVAGQMLYVGGRYAYGLRASDGHVMWRYGSRAQFYQPVAAAGVVFIGSSAVGGLQFHPFGIGSNDFVNALDARTGTLYWRTSGTVESTPLVSS